MELKLVDVKNPEALNIVFGQSHFIKTVEDVYEVLIQSSATIKFGLAFCEASGKTLIRHDGNDEELRMLAVENAKNIAAGHCFFIVVKDAFPINFLPSLKNIPEICRIFCATANPVQVVVAQSDQGRGVMGVIDGSSPSGIEGEEDIAWRKDFLRKIGYKR